MRCLAWRLRTVASKSEKRGASHLSGNRATLPESALAHERVLTGQDLEDGGEEEATALHQFEQLEDEGHQREEAEEHGQDHQGLHRLDPVWEAQRSPSSPVYAHAFAFALANLHRWLECTGR